MKKKKILFLIVFICILCFPIFKKFCYLKVSITNVYYIQQKMFTNNYVLKSKKNGIILEHIYEWRNEKNYIYGSGSGYYFIYDMNNYELLYYDEKNDIESYYKKLEKLELKYRMDNCKRIIDYRKIF